MVKWNVKKEEKNEFVFEGREKICKKASFEKQKENESALLVRVDGDLDFTLGEHEMN